MLLNLLTGVGGMDVGDVVIGKIPTEVQEWAYAMYEAKQDSMGQSVSQLDEFYDILMTTGITGGSSSDTSSAASSVGGGSAGVEAAVSWAEAVAAESPRRVHYSMDRRTWIDKNPGYVDCSAFVWYSLQKNGWEQVDGFRKGTWPMTTVTESATLKKGGFDTFDWDGNDISVLQRGDIVYYDSGGGAHGHTEWYCGDGYFCGSRGGKGPIKTKGLSTTKMRHYCRYMGNDIVDAQVESQGGAGGKVGPCAYNSSDSYWDGTTKRNTSYGIGLENDGYNGAIAGANFKQDEKTYGFAALTNNNGLFASRKKYPYGTIIEVGQTKKDSSGKNRAMRVVLCDWGTGGSDRRDMDFQCAPYNYITENGKLSASNLKYKVVSKGKGYNSFKYKDLIP